MRLTPSERKNSAYILKTIQHQAGGDRYVVLTDHHESVYLDPLRRLVKHHDGVLLEVEDLATLHRDVGAILARYVDVRALVPEFFGEKGPGAHDEGVRRSREYLHRLACQMLARSEGFTQGFERSYHYGNVDAETGHIHVGMISHLGTMIPVAAGLAFALKRSGSTRASGGIVVPSARW